MCSGSEGRGRSCCNDCSLRVGTISVRSEPRRDLPFFAVDGGTVVMQPRAVIFFVNLVGAEDQNQDIAIFGSTYT
jgi:hypothetical protein